LPPITRRHFIAGTAAAAATATLWPEAKPVIAADTGPNLQFPALPRDRIAIASYPFREIIAGAHDKPYPSTIPKMDLKNFAVFVKSKFNINKIEPWSEHFRSLEAKYLSELRTVVEKSGGGIVNIAADGEHSPYAADKAEREKAVSFSKQWIDIAAAVGSPSVRTNMPPAKDSSPDLDRAVDTLLHVAGYAAAKNILVNLENDNPVSEDPFFIVSIIEKVNSPWVHTNPDFANSLTTGKTEYAYKGIAAMFQHAYSICHVKATEADEKGQLVHVDMARTFSILKSSNYKGYCSMEFDSPGDPNQGTSDLIEETLKFLA
jgi:sugar phosphate isomerase/epimerase